MFIVFIVNRTHETADPAEFITPAEAGRLLGKSHTTIQRWIEQEHLVPARRLPNGRVELRRSDVEAYLDTDVDGAE